MIGQIFKEANDTAGGDVNVRVQGKIKSYALAFWRKSQGRDHGNLFMGAGFLIKKWGVSLRRPGSPNQRRHEQPTLVEKDQMGSELQGFFLMAGHSILTHRRIAFSSRSMARRSGFWGLKPNECKSLDR